MKCKSCESEINPKWKFAVKNNICPFCGESVMDGELIKLLADLDNTISSLSTNYSNELNDWMLLNFNFIKTDSPNLTKYVKSNIHKQQNVRALKEEYEDEDEEDKVVNTSGTDFNQFVENAGAAGEFSSLKERNEHIKKLAEKIKQAGVIPAKATVTEDYEDMEQSYDNESEPIPSIVLNAANKAQSSGYDVKSKDLEILKNMQNRIRNSKRNFLTGANRGKNGFWRA